MEESNSSPACERDDNIIHLNEIKQEEDNFPRIPTSMEEHNSSPACEQDDDIIHLNEIKQEENFPRIPTSMEERNSGAACEQDDNVIHLNEIKQEEDNFPRIPTSMESTSRVSGVGRSTTSGGDSGFHQGGGQMGDIPIQAEMPPHSSDNIFMDENNISPAREEGDNILDPEEIEQEEENFDNFSGVPTLMESGSSKLKITLNAKGEFEPGRECQLKLKETIETKYCDDVECWTKINPANRNVMFDYWKSFFQWDPRIPETRIRNAWEKKAAYTFKQKMYYLRSKVKGKKKPLWMSDNAWRKTTKSWNSPTYKSLCERNAKNRASDCGGRGVVVNHGGAMSRTRHEEKLRNELGREPTQSEIWKSMNATKDKDGNLKFHSTQAEEMHTNYLHNLAQHPDMQGHGDDYQPPMELQLKVWAETQGISKKGAVVGLASDAKFVKPSSSRTWTSTPDPGVVDLRQEVQELRSQNATLIQQQQQQQQQMQVMMASQQQLQMMMEMMLASQQTVQQRMQPPTGSDEVPPTE